MDETVLGLTARVVAGYVSNNRLSGEQLPELIEAVYRSLSTAGTAAATAAAKIEPAVAVKKSLFADHLVCLACGASFSMLKRHLNTEHQLTPIEYRERYGLARDYPLVAPDYAKVRSRLGEEDRAGCWWQSSSGSEAAGRQKRPLIRRPYQVPLAWRVSLSHPSRCLSLLRRSW